MSINDNPRMEDFEELRKIAYDNKDKRNVFERTSR